MVEEGAFVRLVRVESVPEGGVDHVVEASEAERLALAEANGLAAVGRLTGRFSLKRAGRGAVRVTGEVHAEATQICVVSLEPFDVALDEDVEVRYAAPAGESSGRRGKPPTPTRASDFTVDEEDQPDSIVDGKIDLGALAVEFMILGLDPYPRKPGVAFDESSQEKDQTEAPAASAKDGEESP
jgi:Large ribosomal RNA subunit accumulation protein YceD